MSGLDPTGLSPETTQTILEAVASSQRGSISQGLSLSGSSLLGNINGIVADAIAGAWQALQAVHSQFDPDSAEGMALDTVCALVGVYRQKATKTVVTVNCTVGSGFSQPAGTMFVTVAGDSNRRFQNSFPAVSPGGGVVPFQFEAVDTGPIVAPAGTLTAITPVSGWTAATNPTDATPGRNTETDTNLRIRRTQELAKDGAASSPAIRAAVGALDNVTSVNVLENDGDTTDGNSVPPHSIEVVVEGGANLDIATAIQTHKAGGIRANGTTTVNVTDAYGVVWPIGFTRPSAFNIYLAIQVKVDSTFGGDTNLKAALVLWGDAYYQPGQTVIGSRIAAQLFSLLGIVDVVNVFLGLAPGPSSTAEIGVPVRDKAVLDSTRITVYHV